MSLPRLLNNFSRSTAPADTSTVYEWPETSERVLFIAGTFAAAIVQIQISPDGQDWFDYEDPILEPDYEEVELQAGVFLRLRITGGGQDTVLTAWV